MKNFRIGVIEKYNSIIHGIPNHDLFRPNGSIRLTNQYMVVDEWCSNSYAQNKLSTFIICSSIDPPTSKNNNNLIEFSFSFLILISK